MADDIYTESGRLVKMEVDYSSTCDQKIPQCEELAKNGKLDEALETLLSLEKQTRTGSDAHSTSRILVAIVRLCYEARNWNALNEHVVLLSKRRSQIKMAVTKMVQECCLYIDNMPDRETMLKFIDTLRTVTAGKIYVEVERARLTHKLSTMKEQDGDVEGAATIMQELQVETFGSMEKKEKVELILEQMRLCLARNDYIRTQIISKKVSTKFFDEAGTEDLKLRYYKLMIELDQHEGSFLAICKHYRAIYNTPSIQEDPLKKHEALKCMILYLILAPYDNEQSDLLHRIKQEKYLEEVPKYSELPLLFTTAELIQWTLFSTNFEQILRVGSQEIPRTDVFTVNTEDGDKRWKSLKSRVVEHNIRVMAKYYTRITLHRMSELLDLTNTETEEFLSTLVVNKTVQAKVDRLEGIVNFAPHKDPNDLLNEWVNSINSLMQLVNRTTHLINKEEMVHMHLLPARE